MKKYRTFILLKANIYLFSNKINEFMCSLSLLEKKPVKGQSPSGTGHNPARTVPSDPPSFQRLLDVISSIIAEEYIVIAKQNPEIFKTNGGLK